MDAEEEEVKNVKVKEMPAPPQIKSKYLLIKQIFLVPGKYISNDLMTIYMRAEQEMTDKFELCFSVQRMEKLKTFVKILKTYE